jgi:hypothetical protein
MHVPDLCCCHRHHRRLLESLDLLVDRATLNILLSGACCAFILHLASCMFFYMAYLDSMGPGTWAYQEDIEGKPLGIQWVAAGCWAIPGALHG